MQVGKCCIQGAYSALKIGGGQEVDPLLIRIFKAIKISKHREIKLYFRSINGWHCLETPEKTCRRLPKIDSLLDSFLNDTKREEH